MSAPVPPPLSPPDKPAVRPQNPNFSSGPCAKRPGWSLAALEGAYLGRSHRASGGKAKLAEVIQRSKELLDLPEDWRLGIVPASDTGAVEMALWSLLGRRGVDLFVWEAFGQGWADDVVQQLALEDARVFSAAYGDLPDLTQADPARDLVFTWNGTTSGVRVPNANWIPRVRDGLVICDATSAAFAMALDYSRLDVVTWSWQKVLGGEAAHGMLALSPRAIERLENYSPPWPLPKIFRLTKDGKVLEAIFRGETINTPSLLCVEDALDGLRWAADIGGLAALIRRTENNFKALSEWLEARPWIGFLARAPETRSTTSACLQFTDPWFRELPHQQQTAFARAVAAKLEAEGVAYDIGAYRDAPPGLRIWTGATVETSDLTAMLAWLEWAWFTLRAEQSGSAASG